MPVKKTLWPKPLCSLFLVANAIVILILIVGIPAFTSESKSDPSDYIDFWMLEISCFLSALSYWLVLRGYDFGRWLNLIANLFLTFLFLYWAKSGNNLKLFTVVLAALPLVWPGFLLFFFKRKPE